MHSEPGRGHGAIRQRQDRSQNADRWANPDNDRIRKDRKCLRSRQTATAVGGLLVPAGRAGQHDLQVHFGQRPQQHCLHGV